MHATYAFLLHIDTESGDREGIAAAAKAELYEFANQRFDENNWYQEEALVLDDGTLIGLCEDGDWRGREALAKEFAKMPEDARWEHARLTALQCVVNDFELGGRSPYGFPVRERPKPEDIAFWKSFDTLHARVLEEMPARMAQMWRHAGDDIAVMKKHPGDQEPWVRRYNLRKWSRQIAFYLDALEYGHLPFSSDGGPYDYRAFDLTHGEEGNAILFVDIHT